MVDNVSSEIRSGWHMYPFSPDSFEIYLHIQIKRSL